MAWAGVCRRTSARARALAPLTVTDRAGAAYPVPATVVVAGAFPA